MARLWAPRHGEYSCGTARGKRAREGWRAEVRPGQLDISDEMDIERDRAATSRRAKDIALSGRKGRRRLQALKSMLYSPEARRGYRRKPGYTGLVPSAWWRTRRPRRCHGSTRRPRRRRCGHRNGVSDRGSSSGYAFGRRPRERAAATRLITTHEAPSGCWGQHRGQNRGRTGVRTGVRTGSTG